jgi:predicted transcriptional regulator
MGMIQLSDEVHAAVEHAVARGLSSSATSLVEEAVMRLLEDMQLEQEEIARVAAEGIADIEAGRYVTITTAEEHRALMDDILANVRNRRTDKV